MDWLLCLFLLYLGSNVSAFNECNRCECCKNDRCQHYNGYHDNCKDGCIDGFYGTMCTHACMTNCLACENVSTCTKCNDGFYLHGSFCYQCPHNCLTCSSNTNCNTCRDGSYLHGSFCFQCPHNCLTCSSNSNCNSCRNGFYLHGSSCNQCPQKCLTCSSKSNCNTCRDGFYSGEQYDNPVYFYYYDCPYTCKNNCRSCTSYHSCTECKEGKFNWNYNDCRESCHSACKSCTSSNTCTQCETGKYGISCQNDCGRGCENHQCDIITGMCTCMSGFQGDKCDQCAPGVYGINCKIPCPTGCLNNICSINGKCSCKSGFTGSRCDNCVSGKYGTSCDIPCPAGCVNNACSKDGHCTYGCKHGFVSPDCNQCFDGKYGNNCDKDCLKNCKTCASGTNCSVCYQRYWGSTCQSCPSNCSKCVSSTECVSCKSGYYGLMCDASCPKNCESDLCGKTNGTCTCTFGFYGKFCNQTCPKNCANNICKSDGNCKSCKKGYYDITCDRKCTDNCEECSVYSGSCLKCYDGYYGHSCDSLCPSYCKAVSSCKKSDGHCTECADGFYYRYSNYSYHCNNLCSETCKSCKDKDFKCIQCRNGKYGKRNSRHTHLDCHLSCPKNCLNITCHGVSGHCTEGCVSGYWGVICDKSCPLNCKDEKCYASNGKCVSGCEEGYTGSHCKCSINCNCDANENCINCTEGYYNIFKDCTCSKDFCADPSCTTCSNSTSYAFNAACCQCSSTCKYSKCQSENKCTDGCIDGYHSDDCSRFCKDIDQYCLKCTADFAISSGKCLECISGYYPNNRTKTCKTCSEYCFDKICSSVTGKCQNGCKDGHWGDKCEDVCKSDCLKCNQLNRECSVCRHEKYFKNCSKDCSKDCNATNGLIMCAVDDGACLSGCDTATKYGSHCEKNCSSRCLNNTCNWRTGYCLNGCVGNFFGKQCNKPCSVNCVTEIGDERSCNDETGECILGCKDGFRGDTCEKKCSENCVNNTCDKASGKCVHGCKNGFSGSSCTEALSQRGTDEDTTITTVGAAVGALLFILITIAVSVVLIVLKKRRRREKEDKIDTNESNDNAAVTYSGILTGTPAIDINDTGAVYAMPNKPKRNLESKSPEETTETKTVRNPNYEKVKSDSAAVYQNAAMRDSQQTAAKENVRQFVESALEIEEDLNNIALRESKMMAQTDGSCTYESEAADTYYNVTAVKKRRIMVDKLAKFVSTKTIEDFAEEFLQLPPGLIKPYMESQKRKNAPKNRYKDIYPYDDTRVVIKDGDSDYINASYIDGYVKRRAYIASIGPTYKYMGDMSAFWKMVWQEQAGKIVMLTNLSEAGVPKCDQYWPDKDFSELYANVQVTCKSEEAYADYTVRSFVAQKGSEKRSIVQVHFTAWPDKGIPDDVTSLIEFRQKVNSIKTKLDGPIIVHCSAGIGRTGTYIALDSLTLEGEVEGGVDIYACVRNLREQRLNMVQTAEQYRYLHNAVVHTLTFDSKAVEATKFSEYMNTHTDVHLAENFQKLQSSVENRPDDEIEAVMKNKSLNNKNRKGADIPGDRNRPQLYLDRNLGSSDYINALYVNSFKSVNRYIVAQTPMPDTVGDFLALIVQEKVTCAIDMESHMTKQDNVGAYFQADNQTLKKGTFTVKSEPGEKTDQYIFRKLKVSHKKSEEITVKHIQFTKWDDKNDLPEDPGKFVQFIRDIELKYCDSEKEGPILVHCLTGAEKSGLFCAVSVLLEKTQIDQEISVVNTVRQIKYRRHMSVPNKEQYIFCHQCLNEYLRSFDTYSNFGLKV